MMFLVLLCKAETGVFGTKHLGRSSEAEMVQCGLPIEEEDRCIFPKYPQRNTRIPWLILPASFSARKAASFLSGIRL
jgi:hypothetical protein